MRTLRLRDILLGLTAALCVSAPAGAQERTVVSKAIAVGRSEASLRLEFSTGDPLEIQLRDGSVLVDGETAGSYEPGDAVDAAWRALLGEAVALEDGPLAARLKEWSPPAGLEGDRLTLATEIDRALEAALTFQVPALPDAPSVEVSTGRDAALLRMLLGRAEHLSALGEALRDVGADLRVHIDEDVTVGAGETVEGTLVVVQGDLRVDGEVTGNVVVVDGTLDLGQEGRIGGDVRLADAQVHRDGGTVGGEVVNVEEAGTETEVRSELRRELQEELREEIRREIRGESRGFNPFRNLFRAIGGLVENLIGILALAVLGVAVVSFAPRNLEVVAETARRSPGRSAMVGVAGTFLLIPLWVIGLIALVISIVGIPVAIAWLPLFPLAAIAAALLGYLAVARNVGEWLADSGYRYTDRIRKSNQLHTVVGGIVGLMAFFIAANVLTAVPFFGFFRGLLTFVGVMATIVAFQIGFGAVLLTRAGRRPEYAPVDFDDAWERAVDIDVDVSPADTSPQKDRGGDDA